MSSKFLSVQCKCGKEQAVFNRTSSIVKCNSCTEPLAHPAGGEAVIHGKVVKELG
jgi:ribosomal protein S27E